MRRIFVLFIVLMLLVPLLPQVSAQTGQVVTGDSITVVRGDYSAGILHLTNTGGRSYRVVSLQRFWVEDQNGNELSGFNLTLDPKIFSDWGPGNTVITAYNLSCSPDVPAGNYTLYLRFLASTAGGSLYILFVKVPLRVLPGPLELESTEAYVSDRPGSPYALNGERIVLTSHVLNIGHRDIPARASVSFDLGGRPYFHTSRSVVLTPGDNVLTFIVPVGYDLPKGRYVLHYTLSYPGGNYSYSKAFEVRFGVRVVGLSVRSNSVRINEENEAYLTVISERSIRLNLTAVTYRGGSPIARYGKCVSVASGTDVITIPLVTNVSGNLSTLVRLSFGNRTIGGGWVNYSVVAPPVIENVTYSRVSSDEVAFSLVFLNPSDQNVSGVLQYRIYTDSGVLYRDSMTRSIPPGVTRLRITFKVPVGEEIHYRFTLLSSGSSSSVGGDLYLKPPQTTTTSTMPITTTSSTSTTAPTTTAGGSGSRGTWIALLLVVFFLLAVGAWYYLGNEKDEKKRRVRPKPKRRSPLGRFKRPKKPEFRENRELPKK